MKKILKNTNSLIKCKMILKFKINKFKCKRVNNNNNQNNKVNKAFFNII